MKPEKVTITRITRYDKDKNGQPLVRKPKDGKPGRPYTKCNLITKEHGDSTWISGFGNKTTDAWKDGDVVEIVIEKNGQYLNFSIPDAVDLTKALEGRVWQLETEMATVLRSLTAANLLLKKKPYPTEGNDPDAIDAAFARESAKDAQAKAEADKAKENAEAARLIENSKKAVEDFNNEVAAAAANATATAAITEDDLPQFTDKDSAYGL